MKPSYSLLAVSALFAAFAANALDDYPVDLSKVVNMGFADEAAGDGKGGWSDQGPENDMRGFDVARRDYEGVTVKTINPDKNGGKAVVSFWSKNFPQGPKSVKVDLPKDAPAVTQLYLLHTSCWNTERRGEPIASVEITFEDGGAISKELKAGIDIADWWGAGSLENGKCVVKKSNGSSDVGVFFSRFEISKAPRKVRSLEFKSDGKALWILAGATLSLKEIPMNMGKTLYAASDEWRAVDFSASSLRVKESSALDLSGISEPGPAGKHGRLIASKSGALAFEDSPETPRRFRGSNSFWTLRKLDNGKDDETKERMGAFAENFRRFGYDIIRLLPVDAYLMMKAKSDAEYNPIQLDKFDWLMACLKKNGVYSYLSIAAYNMGRADLGKGWRESNSAKAKVFLGDPESLARWKACAENLLNHVNPYTGLALKDDPAIAVVEPYNEQEFGFITMERNDAETSALFERRWGDWLKAKFGTPEALVAKSNDLSAAGISSFDSVKIPPKNGGFLSNEFCLFRQETVSERLAWYRDALRAIGYKGLISEYNMAKDLAFCKARAEGCDVVSNDGYFAHPSDGVKPGSKCPQDSSVGQAGGYWRGIAATRLGDRPFIVNEHKHAFWNQYRHENALLFPAYSAFQGFDAILVHCDPTLLDPVPIEDFQNVCDPISIANEFVGALLYKRGDAARSAKSVELLFPAGYLESACQGETAISSEQSKISLMTGFNVAFEGARKPDLVPVESASKPDFVVAPGAGSAVGGSAWFQSVQDSKDKKFDLAGFVETLKAKGVLPKENLSDPEKGVFQSANGEILMKAKDRFISVSTPRVEGVSLEANKPAEIKRLKVASSSVPAAIAACSVDGKPLASSSRIVLVYATDAVNSGMELSEDRSIAFKAGSLPILLRSGKLEASIKTDSPSGFKLYALSMDGSRKEELPLPSENGELKIEIETSKLKSGATPFFEISRD